MLCRAAKFGIVLGLTLAATAHAALTDLLVTEIMYDPAGGNEHEYIEVFNAGDTTVNLNGIVFDRDGNLTPAAATFTQNVLLAPGEAGVLLRIDASRTLANYQNAWGTLIKFAPSDSGLWDQVTNGPDGTTIALGLWSSFAAWQAAPTTPDIADVRYRNGAGGWPAANNAASIYMLDINAADPYAPSNWALSQVGVDGAYAASAPRIVSGVPDVGSPGFVSVPEPASVAVTCAALFGVLVRRRRRHVTC